jgi:hypothetical protein
MVQYLVALILISLNPWFTTWLNTLKLHIDGSTCWVMLLHEIFFFIFYSLINPFMLILCFHIWSKNFHLVMTLIDSLLCSCMMILHIIWRIQIQAPSWCWSTSYVAWIPYGCKGINQQGKQKTRVELVNTMA